MERRQMAAALFTSSAALALGSRKSDAQTCNAPCWAQTTLESMAGVTPYQTQYWPGDIRRYKATSDTDYTNAMKHALQVAQDVYIPAGTSTISSTVDVGLATGANGANRKITGDGMDVSIISVSASGTMDAFTCSSTYLAITMEDLQVQNSHGNAVHFGTTTLINASMFMNLRARAGNGGRAFYLPNEFNTQLINCQGETHVQGWSSGGNVFELGGNTTKLQGCYAVSVPINYFGYRIYSGAMLDSCNGVSENGDQGNWGCFGQHTTLNDPVNNSFYITMVNCNVEDYNDTAVQFRYTGWATILNCVFAKSYGLTYTCEISFEGCSGITISNTIFRSQMARTATSPVFSPLGGGSVICTNTYDANNGQPVTLVANMDVNGQSQVLPNLIGAYMLGQYTWAAYARAIGAANFFNHYSGSVTLSGGQATVPLNPNQDGTGYLITLTGNSNEQFYVYDKETSYFVIKSSNTSSTAKVDWVLTRTGSYY